ncbi:lipopolysaccharide biosynthesis protein [Cytobacillus horneckiae]|uniref:lipopolysaccharide biosynthesis protein n=2 Tax=Bacteria TaxID=2 RepID=UPI003D9A6682
MRIKNTINNILFGVIGQLISIFMSFIVRTVFIYTLGVEYLGVEGLFSSILMMLSLANLGFDTAMIYSLYKPLADKNEHKIQALMNLYKKAYRIIGLIVLFIGLCILPFLSELLNGSTNIKNIPLIYILFLLNSVISYYFVYKQSIIIADQKNYIISKIHTKFIIVSNLAQMIILITTQNYILVLSLQIILRVAENIYLAKKADNLYPFLKEKNTAKLSKQEKKEFFENLYSLLLYKISGVVINGTDNIIISIFLGITIVGIYSNYLLILTTMTSILSYIFYSVTASVGNLHVTETKEKKHSIFRVLHFLNFWTYGFIAILLWNLMNPFLTVWIGEEFVFNDIILFTIILNFYTAGMQNASTTFRETTGLFKKGKYRPIFAAIINIAVSIALVKQIGIAGVLLGTVISRMLTYFWYDPYIIFNYVFNKSVKRYFIRYSFYILIVVIIGIITDFIGNSFFRNSIALNMAFRFITCTLVTNLMIILLFRKSFELTYVFNLFKNIMNDKIFKKQNFKNKIMVKE